MPYYPDIYVTDISSSLKFGRLVTLLQSICRNRLNTCSVQLCVFYFWPRKFTLEHSEEIMMKNYATIETLEKFKLKLAADDVVKERKTLKEAATVYKLKIDDIYVKTGVPGYLEKNPTKKPDYEDALKDVVYRRGTIKEIAAKYKVVYVYLRIQVEYDKYSHTYFSPENDLQLLQFMETTLHCTCQSCYTEQLPSAAYTFAKRKNIKCSSLWETNERAAYQWLKTFEERYNWVFSKLPSDCKKELLCTKEGKEQQEADQNQRESDEIEIVDIDEIPTLRSMEEIEDPRNKFDIGILEID